MAVHSKILPRVPNLIGVAEYALGLLRQLFGHEADSKFPDVLLQPPERFLPALNDMSDAEIHLRMKYWIPALVCNALLTAAACEVIQYMGYLHRRSQDEDEDHDQREQWLSAKLTQHRFYYIHLIYHVFCISLNALALHGGWIDLSRGVSWEFWFIWEEVVMLAHVIQTVIRCKLAPCSALQHRVSTEVLQSVMFMLSDPIDTFRDWVLAFACFAVGGTFYGLCMGVAFIAIESFFNCFLTSSANAEPPEWCGCWSSRATGGVRIRPPLLNMGSIAAIFFLVATSDYFSFHKYLDFWTLAVFMGYIILYAHRSVVINQETWAPLAREYLSIFLLPAEQSSPGLLRFQERVAKSATEKIQDFTSSARLVIAWEEDLPQGIIGTTALLIATPDSIGFAYFSILVSLAKGVLIPSGRQALFWLKRALYLREVMALAETYSEIILDPEEDEDIQEVVVNFWLQADSVMLWYQDRKFEMFKKLWKEADGYKNHVVDETSTLILDSLGDAEEDDKLAEIDELILIPEKVNDARLLKRIVAYKLSMLHSREREFAQHYVDSLRNSDERDFQKAIANLWNQYAIIAALYQSRASQAFENIWIATQPDAYKNAIASKALEIEKRELKSWLEDIHMKLIANNFEKEYIRLFLNEKKKQINELQIDTLISWAQQGVYAKEIKKIKTTPRALRGDTKRCLC